MLGTMATRTFLVDKVYSEMDSTSFKLHMIYKLKIFCVIITLACLIS